jgi:hypothetical protein
MASYWDVEALKDVYLEDSWVLGVVAQPGAVWFELDVVLRESHPQFEAPKPDEQYCYKRGRLMFRDVTELHWSGQGRPPAVDSEGDIDYGSIDELASTESGFRAVGDFGTLEVTTSAPPEIELATSRSKGG